MQKINKLLLITVGLVPAAVYAETDYRAVMTTSFLYLAYAIAFMGGLWALKSAIDGFNTYQEESQRGEGTAGKKIVFRMLIAGVLLNPQASLETTMNTLQLTGGSSGNSFCYAYDPVFLSKLQHNRNKDVNDGSDGLIETSSLVSSAVPGCIETPLTLAQELLALKVKDGNSGVFDKLQTNEDVQFLIAIIQVISTFFYFNAWFTIWSIADGKDRQSTYKGQVLTILFSSFIINLPATITVLVNTAHKIAGG